MIKRLHKNASKQKVPSREVRETRETSTRDGMMTGRTAGILFASFVIAVGAGLLTYLVVGKPGANLAGAALAAGAAFKGAICLLDSIIA